MRGVIAILDGDECVTSLRWAAVFAALATNSVYSLVDIENENQTRLPSPDKTALLLSVEVI